VQKTTGTLVQKTLFVHLFVQNETGILVHLERLIGPRVVSFGGAFLVCGVDGITVAPREAKRNVGSDERRESSVWNTRHKTMRRVEDGKTHSLTVVFLPSVVS